MKKLIEVHKKLNPLRSDWKREAGLWSRIVDLTMELDIGHPLEVTRDKDLVKKAMNIFK